MSFWKGFARALEQEDQQAHERELFQEKLNATRDTEWRKRRQDRQEAAIEQAQEAEDLIRRGYTILGDLDVSAALYQSGQLGDVITSYDEALKDGRVNQSGFDAIVTTVREQAGDSIEGLGSTLIESLQSYDLSSPDGLSEALVDVRTGGKTTAELAAETPTIPQTGVAPAFDIDTDTTQDVNPNVANTVNSVLTEELMPLLSNQLNFAQDSNGNWLVTDFKEGDPNGAEAARVFSVAKRKFRDMTTGPDAMDPVHAAGYIRDFVDNGINSLDPDFGAIREGLFRLDPAALTQIELPKPVPVAPRVTLDSPEDAQEFVGNTGPTVTPAPAPAPVAPQPDNTSDLTFSPDTLSPPDLLDGRETSSWSDLVRKNTRER